MITMGGYGLPSKTIREMIVGSIDVIIQAARLRDGSRRITHITEVMGLEGDVDHHPGPLRLRDRAAKTRTASINGRHRSHRHRAARASGSAPATSAWSANWPRRSTRRSEAVMT